MNKRKFKQILYGAFYLSILAAPLLLFVASAQPTATCFDGKKNQNETDVDCGGKCTPCLIKQLEDIRVLSEKPYLIGDNQLAIAAKIRNPNIGAGAESFTYQIDILGDFGIKLKTLNKQSYILPGETKYLIEGLSNIAARDVKNVMFTIKDVKWKPAELMKGARFSAKSAVAQIVSERFIEINGHIINEGAENYARVSVKVIVYDKMGNILLPLKTEINNLDGAEERAFRFSVSPAQEVLNSFDPNAVVDIETEVIPTQDEVSL